MAEDRISKCFTGKNILITGGTGFLGKVLIEKFLRCVPDVGQIFLLVRTKKGKDPSARLLDIFENHLFDKVKEMRGLPSLLNQMKVFGGDVSEPDLGLSEKDRAFLTAHTNIIYHCAATIRFDEHLKKAVLLNTRGTKLMLQLAKDCDDLTLFVYVSTSYCHLNEKLLLEKPYPPPANPHKIIKAIEWLEEDVVESMTSKILGTLPNTYAYTKALAESLVVEQLDNIPCIILRPSIVIPVYHEPIPGWTDNINGPVGLLIGAGKGVIRTMWCNETGYGDYLPVDFAVNGIMCFTWNFIGNNDRERKIYHMTSSAEVKVSWAQIIDIGRWVVANNMPLNGVMWYPGGSMKSSRLHHRICAILYHWIPAVLIDCLLWCLRYPPVLCRVHRRIEKGFEVFEYYANNQWDFDNANILHMRTKINAIEEEKFPIEQKEVDMYDYFTKCVHCARLYILNEPDDTLPAARRHMRIMYWVDKICKFIIVALFIYYVGGFMLKTLFGGSGSKVGSQIIDSI